MTLALLFLAALLAVMVGSGLFVSRLFGLRGDPFVGLVGGFVVVGHALMLGDVLTPGAHP